MPKDYDFKWDFIDNSDQIMAEFERRKEAALEEIGLRAEGYAKKNAPVGTPESTGIKNYISNGLRKSLTHKVVGNEVYIGTNQSVRINGRKVHYPIYVELGTGIYADNGRGRKNPWAWRDKNGKLHWTKGMKPRHFLKKAATEHSKEYKEVVLKHLKANAPLPGEGNKKLNKFI